MEPNGTQTSLTVMRNKTETGDLEKAKFSLVLVICYSMLYVATYIVAIVGNIMALLTCFKNYRITTSILLVYIASLAVADLLFILLSTFDYVYFFTHDWIGRDAGCKLQGFLIETTYSASILTLVAISYERLRSVASKSLARKQRIERRTIISKSIWVFSAVISSPLLYGYSAISDMKTGNFLCLNNISWGDKGRQIYYSCQAVFIYLLPLSFMIWAHYRIFRVLKVHTQKKMISTVESKQRKITQMLGVVTVIFFACWSPFIVVRALRYYYVYEGFEVWKLTQLVILLNSAVNPILYCFYSGQFRSAFKDMIRCQWKLNLRKLSTRSTRRRDTLHSHSPNSFEFADKSEGDSSSGWNKLETLKLNKPV